MLNCVGMGTNPGRLEGWKEIATYLNRSVRAVQVWEKESGLPVHRLQNRVYADAADLDRWRDQQREFPAPEGGVPVIATEPVAPPPRTGQWHVPLLAALLTLAVATAVGWRLMAQPPTPVEYRVDGRVLSVFDENRTVLWRFTLPTAPPAESTTAGGRPQRGKFRDLDGDGRPELLYAYWPADMGKENSTLYCFRLNGEVLWRTSPGNAITLVDGRQMAGLYRIAETAFLKTARPDGGQIVLSSNHSWDWPHQVAILRASDGVTVDEYWHPGWLPALAVRDLDGDGSEEILAGGVNNAYLDSKDLGATLVVLPSAKSPGQGRVPPGYRLQLANRVSGGEKAVLLFPEFEKNANPNYYCHVERIFEPPGEGIELLISQHFAEEAFASPYIHVELDRNLRIQRVIPDGQFAKRLLDRRPGLNPAERGKYFLETLGQAHALR